MGLFENLPYTDFHRLNLEWLLREMRRLRSDYEAFKADTLAAWEAFENAVSNMLREMETKMDGWEERIGEVESAWATYRQALDAEFLAFKSDITGQMDGWETRISTLESSWDEYQSALDSAWESFQAAITGQLDGWETRIGELESAWEDFYTEIRELVDGLPDKVAALEADGKLVDISAKFTQDGSLDQFRRSVYRINGITYGTMRFGGYHGTGEIEITVADEAIPVYGSFASYREEPVGTVDISHLIDTGYISSYIPSRKDDPVNGLLPSKPDNFIQPLNTKAGSGFLIRVPNNVRLAMLEYPDCTCIIQFTYVAEDRL